ncbi:MAG: CHAT domain-containing protein [Planctomycetia bacterium]|nr:CHAT domain-containing protein [Planctomycetia bacterium]
MARSLLAGSRGGVKPALCAASLASMALLLSAVSPLAAQIGVTQSVPSPSYFQALSVYWDGDYKEALELFQDEWRGGIKNGTNRWIDSICYHTMIGECYYQMGQHQLALDQYTRALQLYYVFSDWMVRVQFPPNVRPSNPGEIKTVPWSQSTRQPRYGHYPETMSIGQGQFLTQNALRQPGPIAVQQPIMFPIHVQEIVRCTALSMRRRRELMGPACAQDQLTGDLVTALARRPGPANHWSEAWIELELGIAYAAADKDVQAKASLERAVVVAGEYDHPMTGMALFELGRMALAAGEFDAAAKYFAEASYSAGAFVDVTTTEESLRYGQLTHLLANRQGLFPPLVAATAWARASGLRQMQASMLILAAENYCVLSQPQMAVNLLADARNVCGRHAMVAGKIGARLNFITGLAAYQQGNVQAGDQATAAALAFQKTGSLWLFHIALADTLYTQETITPRIAMELYQSVLRDPTATDWATDPLESLSKMVVPQTLPYDHWFEVAVERKDHERVLEISDLARRHRFLSTLDFGGRVHNLRWLLEGPEEVLSAEAKLQRQDLLARYGAYAQLKQQAQALRKELLQAPLAAGHDQAARPQNDKLAKLSEVSAAQEKLLREMAVRREPGDIVFPPFRPTKEIKAGLPAGAALLSFFSTARQSYALLLTRDKYGYWKIPRGDALAKPIAKLMQGMASYESRELTLSDLKSETWKEPARQILDSLTKDSRADLKSFSQLIVVPDGVLWNVPFEVLEMRDGDKLVPLASRMQVRYAPLVSLAVADPRPRRAGAHTGVVVGRLTPGGDGSLARATFEEINKSLPGAVALTPPLPQDAPAFASLLDALVVLNDVTVADGEPYDWSPMPAERAGAGGTLDSWFPLPFGGPDVVVMPSFHVATEKGKKQSPGVQGNDMFLSMCGLMANGARTILVGRWRTGGQTSADLVREFVQELPHATAADAWQRSRLVVCENPLNPTLEPRVKLTSHDDAPKADHPFFWAGYMLVDTGAVPQEVADERRAAPPADAAAAQTPADKAAAAIPADPSDKRADGRKPAAKKPAGDAPAAADRTKPADAADPAGEDAPPVRAKRPRELQ